jgi:hypothetical protein
MLSNLPNLQRSNFKKASLHEEKTVINRLLDFSGVQLRPLKTQTL